MYCNRCGTELGERETFCPNCGFRVVATVESAQQLPTEPSYVDLPPQMSVMPMKWYKINIYFLLWTWIVQGPLLLISLLVSVISPKDPVELIPLIIEICSVVAYLFLSGFAWVVRKQLAEYRQTAPQTLRLFRIFTIATGFVFNVATAFLTMTVEYAVINVYMQLLSMGIALAVWLLCEGRYYEKREHLFIY